MTHTTRAASHPLHQAGSAAPRRLRGGSCAQGASRTFLPKTQPLCPPTSSCPWASPPRTGCVLWKLRACPTTLRASAKDFVLQTLSKHCTCSRMCLGRSGGILQRGPETCVDHPRAVRGHCSPSTALPRFGGAAKTRFTFLAYVYAKTRFTFLALKPVLPLSVAPPPLHCVLNESSSSPLLLSLCIE